MLSLLLPIATRTPPGLGLTPQVTELLGEYRMGGEGATSPWPKLIVVFETNLLEGCCKLGAFKVKVFLAENFVSSCCWLDGFLNICKLDGCCKEEAFKLELMPRLEGCSCAVAALVVVVFGDNGEAFKQNCCTLALKCWPEGFKREDDRVVC